MDNAFVDLHCHSSASDGTLSPAGVVRLARECGLSGIALTDHDTVAGCAEARAEAGRVGLDFMCGIEVSCRCPPPGTLHLLGYGVDPASAVLHDLTRSLIAGRTDRNVKIVRALTEQGVAVSLDEVLAQADGGTVGRPHFAAILVRKGYVSNTKLAFDKYLGQGAAAYVDKETVSPKRAIVMIREAGGLPVLAHPSQLRTQNDAQLRQTIKDLAEVGLAGVEVFHGDHGEPLTELLAALADDLGLLKTGGSDFHGGNKAHARLGWAGNRRVPRAYFEAIVSRLAAKG